VSLLSPAPTVQLTEAQVRFYHDNGYLVVRGLTTVEEVEWLREVYDELFDSRTGRERGDQFDLAGADEEGETAKLPQILNPSGYRPELKHTLAWANARQVMTALWGQEPASQGDHAILKPAGYGAPTPWHQDEAYWDPTLDYCSLSIWMPLQDVDERSGCLHFVPGSHLQEVLPHRPIGGDSRVHGLELDCSPPELARAVSCPLAAGDCTVHHQRTLHYAPPNESDVPRRAWILMGGLEAKPLAESRDFPWQAQRHTARSERARAAEAGA